MTIDDAMNVFTSATTATLLTYQAAGRALAAEVRRTQAMRCTTCKHRATHAELGGTVGDPDYTTYWCCVMPDGLSVEEMERGYAVGQANVLCDVMGGGCLAWEKRDELS